MSFFTKKTSISEPKEEEKSERKGPIWSQLNVTFVKPNLQTLEYTHFSAHEGKKHSKVEFLKTNSKFTLSNAAFVRRNLVV